MKEQRRLFGLLTLAVVTLGPWWLQGSGGAREPGLGRLRAPRESPRPAGLDGIGEADLPREARCLLALVDAGGPFRYRQDGAVFENRERHLVEQSRGHYREFTVETPGSDDRGARRMVVGHDSDFYYTEDHYGSFREVDR